MKLQTFLTGLVLVAATATITSVVVSGPTDEKKPATGRPAGNANQQPAGAPGMTPEMQEMMQKCTEAGKIGPNHQLLSKRAGKWTCSGKFWMIPEAPPMETTFTSEAKSIYDGRYVTESVEGQMPEGTFLGQSWSGYDNVTKKFFWSWISNDCTSKMDGTGTYDAATKTFTYTTTASCPLAGKQVTGRSIEKWIDNDHVNVEFYGPWYKTGKEYKMMEFTYTRAK